MITAAPPVTPIKVTNGYRATGALPDVKPAKLTPAAYPGALPKAYGYAKDIGNANTYKLAALDGLDASKTFRAQGSVEQAVAAAALLAATLRGGTGKTTSYAVLADGSDLYVTPMWMKNGLDNGTRVGFDVDWRGSMSGGNSGRGTAAKALDPIFVAAVGATRWIDVRGTAPKG